MEQSAQSSEHTTHRHVTVKFMTRQGPPKIGGLPNTRPICIAKAGELQQEVAFL